MVEGGTELIKLLLADAFGVPGQDLVLHLVDGAVDGSEKLLPSNTQGLHGILGVPGGGGREVFVMGDTRLNWVILHCTLYYFLFLL